jgi:hypothetical protein
VLLPGRSTLVTLGFRPSSQGTKTATLVSYSSDTQDGPLELRLSRMGRGQDESDDTPESAAMSTSYLLVDPGQMLQGQQVTGSANACNNGEEKGALAAIFMVNGSAEQSQSVSVSGGSV